MNKVKYEDLDPKFIEHVINIALNNLNYYNSDLDDLKQVGRLAIVEALEIYKPKLKTLKWWLVLVIKGRMINYLNVRKNYVAHIKLIDNIFWDWNADKLPPIYLQTEQAEVYKSTYNEDMLELKEKYKWIKDMFKNPRTWEIILDILDGLSYSDIAEKHKVPVKVIDNQLTRIRSKLSVNKKSTRILKKSHKRRIVLKYTLDGKFLGQYRSITKAAKSLNLNILSNGNISHCCYGRINQAYGYKWKFKKEKV